MKAKLYFLLLGLCSAASNAQIYIPAYGQIVDQCSQAEILNDLTEFESFGVKYRGTPAQANALQWLKDKYMSFGYTADQIVEDPFTYSGSTCKNLIVTKTGTLYPNTYVIIDGHYDTVAGPGTNDNGSGIAVILEIARLLKDVPTEYSIKFINFSGEEDGLVGSEHYVETVVNGTTPKMDIRLVFNLDQVGGVANEVNNTITCERDTSNSPSTNNAASSAMTNQLITCVGLYSTLNTNLSFAYASDYMPFEDNNEVITGFYETNESPYPHTASDLLINMDPAYLHNVARAAIGAALHFAVACTNCGLGTIDVANTELTISPNPAHENLFLNMGAGAAGNINYTIMNTMGALIRKDTVYGNGSATISVRDLPSGMYVISAEKGDQKITRKFIKK